MTTHLFARAVLAALGLCFVLVSGGEAGQFTYHGSLCHPAARLATVNLVDYSPFGVHNVSNVASALVSCGGAHDTFNPILVVTVVAYDRHPFEDVTCTLVLVDFAGGTLFVDTRSSSGAHAELQLLEFFPGVLAATIYLECSIPPSTEAPGASHVTTYTVTTP